MNRITIRCSTCGTLSRCCPEDSLPNSNHTLLTSTVIMPHVCGRRQYLHVQMLYPLAISRSSKSCRIRFHLSRTKMHTLSSALRWAPPLEPSSPSCQLLPSLQHLLARSASFLAPSLLVQLDEAGAVIVSRSTCVDGIEPCPALKIKMSTNSCEYSNTHIIFNTYPADGECAAPKSILDIVSDSAR